jgi:FKBP-type peptidyl-prolyl cis-trans isomerase
MVVVITTPQVELLMGVWKKLLNILKNISMKIKMKLRWLSLVFVFVVFSSHSCKENAPQEQQYQSEQEIKDKLIEFNQNKVKAEDQIIDDYANQNYQDIQKSETGIRYKVYNLNDQERLQNNDVALVDYRINLLNGEEIYTTASSGPQKIRVGHEDIASGFHEALSLMSNGDSAIFILPSYRAYGFTGEKGSVPQNAILIYHVNIIDVE